jgi:hypothetical protein
MRRTCTHGLREIKRTKQTLFAFFIFCTLAQMETTKAKIENKRKKKEALPFVFFLLK